MERTLVFKVVSVVVTGRLEYESRSISCAHDNSARPLGRWYVLIIAGFTIITGKVCRWVSRGGTLWPQSSAERVKRSSLSRCWAMYLSLERDGVSQMKGLFSGGEEDERKLQRKVYSFHCFWLDLMTWKYIILLCSHVRGTTFHTSLPFSPYPPPLTSSAYPFHPWLVLVFVVVSHLSHSTAESVKH